MARWTLILFALPFLGVGVSMTGCQLALVREFHIAQGWVEVPATILEADLKSKRTDDSTTYIATATYEYQYQARKYRGTRVALSSGADNVGSFQQRVYRELRDKRAQGKPARCWVNPDNPEDSVLNRELRGEILLFQALFGFVFGGVGLGLFVGSYVSQSGETISSLDNSSAVPPWEQWRSWKEGLIPAQKSAGPPIVFALAGYWTLAGLPLVLAAPEILATPGWSRWVLGVPAIFWGGAVWLAIRMWRSLQNYGPTTLRLAFNPGIIGGNLAGVIQVPQRLQLESGVWATLKATREGHEGTPITLWEKVQLLGLDLADSHGTQSALPVEFTIPFDAVADDWLENPRTVTWAIEVVSGQPNVPFRAKFIVPVFRTADSDSTLLSSNLEDRAAPPVATPTETSEAAAMRRLQAAGYDVLVATPERLAIQTPLIRWTLTNFILCLISGVLFLASLLWGVNANQPAEWFGVAILAVFTTAILLITVNSLLWNVQLECGDGTIQVAHGWGGWRRRWACSVSQVARITKSPAYSVNEVEYYRLNLKTVDGHEQTVGCHLTSSIAEDVRSALSHWIPSSEGRSDPKSS